MARPLSITNNNSVTLSTSTKKYGSASGYFSTSETPAAYLSIPNAGEFDFGTSNFTIEWWYYLGSSAEGSPAFLSSTNWVIRAIDLGVTNDTNLVFENNPTGTGNDFTYDTGNTNIALNAWHHFAVVRNGNTLDWYVDGTKRGSGQSVTGLTIDAGSELRLGVNYALTSSTGLNSYVDEFRISNTARYTANFTAPTSALVDDANTLVLLNFDGSNGSTTIVDRVNIQGASSVSASASLTATGRDAPFIYLDDPISDGYLWNNVPSDTWDTFENDRWSNSPTDYTWDTVPGDQWTGFWYDRWLIDGLLVGGESTVTATATILRLGASALTAEATVTAQGNYRLIADADLTATATVSAQGAFLRLATADLASTATVSVDALSLVLAEAALTVVATVTAESQPYILGEADLSSEFTVTASAEEFDLATVNLSVETALTAKGGYFLTGAATLSSESTVSAKGGYFLTGASALSASASLTSGSDKFVPGQSSITAESTVTADATKFVRGSSAITSLSTVSVIGGVTSPASADLSTETSVSVSALKLKIGSIIAYNFAGLTADAQMDLVGASDISVVSTMSVSAGRILDIANDYYPYTWDTVPGDLWTGFPDDQWGVAGVIVFSLGEITSSATIIKNAESILSASAELSASALKLVRGSSAMSAVASITASTVTTGSADLTSSATVSISGSRIRSASADLQVFAFQLGLGVRTLGARANLTATASMFVEGNFILLDSVYLHKILRETRAFTVKDESRNLDIVSETRSFIIPDESRLQDILPESRSINTVELNNG